MSARRKGAEHWGTGGLAAAVGAVPLSRRLLRQPDAAVVEPLDWALEKERCAFGVAYRGREARQALERERNEES